MPPFPLVPPRDVARSRRIWRTPPATLMTTPQPPLRSSIAPPLAQQARDENRPTDATRKPHGYLMSKDHVVLGAVASTPRTFLGGIDSASRPMTHGWSSVPDDDGENAILVLVVVVVVTTPPPSS